MENGRLLVIVSSVGVLQTLSFQILLFFKEIARAWLVFCARSPRKASFFPLASGLGDHAPRETCAEGAPMFSFAAGGGL
jgi:hypothetical protein